MILNNNPAVDVEELMKKVRAEAARIRTNGSIEFRRGEPRNQNEVTLAKALDRHRAVTAHLSAADNARQPIAPPKRLRAFGPLASFFTRVVNYLFKRQREYNTSVLDASRELNWMVTIVGEALARVMEDSASLERYRVETFRELRTAVEALHVQIAGLENAHHATRVRADEALEKNAQALSAAVSLAAADEALAGRLEFAHERIHSNEQTIRAISDRLAEVPSNLEVRLSMVDALRDVERRIADNFEASLRAVALLRSEIRQSAPHYASSAAEPRESFDRDDAIFARLGDVFRGARPVIEERFGIYPDIVSKAATVGEETPLLDVGTGRGEWLDILKRRGIPAIGCELNGILVEEGRAQGLSVESADMLAVLRARQPSSLGAITAFHVVEHVTFEYLLESLREAVRVLVPGGIVIFETPDPRNLIVASRTFYLDPTHLHPVPHELLSAVLECFGFTDIRVLDLHVPETPAFPGNDDISAELNRRFSAAQDYAIVARTPRG